MSFSIAFGPVSVADIDVAAEDAYQKWASGVADPAAITKFHIETGQDVAQSSGHGAFVAQGGDNNAVEAYRFNQDQRYMAREALRLVVDTVRRGNLGTEHGDAVDAEGAAVPADYVTVTVAGHGRRLAKSASPTLNITITSVAAPAIAAPAPVAPDEVMTPTA